MKLNGDGQEVWSEGQRRTIWYAVQGCSVWSCSQLGSDTAAYTLKNPSQTFKLASQLATFGVDLLESGAFALRLAGNEGTPTEESAQQLLR